MISVAVIAFLAGTLSAYVTVRSGSVGDFNSRQNVFPTPVLNDRITTNVGGLELVGPGDALVEEVPPAPSVPKPDLNRPVRFPAGFPEDAKAAILAKIDITINALEENQDPFNDWLALASYRKLIDDYAGAAEVLEYMNKVYPSQSFSFGNLGELYHLYLKDYQKSEQNYLSAIANEPARIELYRGLYELYFYSYKTNTSAASDILKTGLAKNPGNSDLLILLAKYYVSVKNFDEAKNYYGQAIAAAKISGNSTLVNALEAELNSLPK